MKKRIIQFMGLTLLLIGLKSTAKTTKDFETFYQKYKAQKTAVCMSFSGDWLQFFTEEEEHKLSSEVSEIKMLIIEQKEEEKEQLLSELDRYLPKENYKDLMIIQSGKDKMVLKFRQIDEQNSELVLLANGEESLFTLSISGKFDEKEAKELIKAINIDKMRKSSSGEE